MAALKLKVHGKTGVSRMVTLQVDAGKFERLAAGFGLFNPDFLDSIDRAERDVRAGRVRKIKSLSDLDR